MDNNEVKLKYLGINGFEFSVGGNILLIDPYVSRTRADEPCSHQQTVRRHIHQADTIFLTHSHWDHLADIPEIVEITGAAVYGSLTSCNSLKSCSVPEDRINQFISYIPYSCGPFVVTPIPSLHKLPCLYPGEYDDIPERLLMRHEFLEGGTWAFLVEVESTSFLILGSANYIASELDGKKTDYLIVSISGRTPEFMTDLHSIFSFQYCIPSHFDFFDTPLENAGIRVSVDEFTEEMRAIDPEIVILKPTPLSFIPIK
ncbi:MBL fold metallo-hydrolase [Oceanispirochaeta crateris]|uniref:MBL fold metallo-hydrolase n=1 Tax=Oceanispirochaeta crateris TaxID=2518645 RepID=UPI00143D0A6C|nr:MBL fold metallo-hydrolase [Oceanispirochaeta crateris]